MRNYTDFHFHAKEHGIKQAIYVAQCFNHSQLRIAAWIKLYESTPRSNTRDFVEKCGLLVRELNESFNPLHEQDSRLKDQSTLTRKEGEIK